MTAENLIRGESKDPAIAARQRSHLVPGGRASHGAYGGPRLAELRNTHDVELAASYPALDDRRRRLLADRLARVELAAAWLDDNGLMRRGQRGDVHPVVVHLERWASRAEDVLQAAEQAQREADKPNPNAVLQEVLDEIAAENARAASDGGSDD
jgi:hypothetical protein